MSSCLQIAPDESQITISAVSGKPILFKGDMVRAILDGRKTQTRRVVKLPSDAEHVEYSGVPNPGITYWTTDCSHYDPCPFGKPGDRLWVRETFKLLLGENHKKCPERGGCHADNVVWAADGVREHPKGGKALWRPSIHMPRWASRITLEITDVRVQRLQDISDEDAVAEGFEWTGQPGQYGYASPVMNFFDYWDCLSSPDAKCTDNPWVWVINFAEVRP